MSPSGWRLVQVTAPRSLSCVDWRNMKVCPFNWQHSTCSPISLLLARKEAAKNAQGGKELRKVEEDREEEEKEEKTSPPSHYSPQDGGKEQEAFSLPGDAMLPSSSSPNDDFIVDGFDFSTGVSICHELASDSGDEEESMIAPVKGPLQLGTALMKVLGVSKPPQQPGELCQYAAGHCLTDQCLSQLTCCREEELATLSELLHWRRLRSMQACRVPVETALSNNPPLTSSLLLFSPPARKRGGLRRCCSCSMVVRCPSRPTP